ncbi:MAG TPA: transglutaminase family protein [Xanthomonadaceae bacterium]|jgi:regulator of sirC expression with transglutaminase-like and TPR domain
MVKTMSTWITAPESAIDLAKAKVAMDRFIDPSIDGTATLRQLDGWAATIRSRVPPGASNKVEIDVLLSTLYRPGPWNDSRPFSYDFDDPFGAKIENKLLSTYLSTRRGNCVSMPILVAILGQKLGLRMTLATAPSHLLVKYASDEGQWLNIEATGGGFKYDTSYERETGISPKAIENELYLRPLTHREAVGAMLSELMEFAGLQGQQERRIALANLALKINPKDVVAMLQKADGEYMLVKKRYRDRYPTPDLIPASQRPNFAALTRDNAELFARAEALGWSEPTRAQEDHYLDTIRHAKTDQGNDR